LRRQEGIPQGLKPLAFSEGLKAKAEALAYLEASAKAKAKAKAFFDSAVSYELSAISKDEGEGSARLMG
jgi:hypothetical protein